MQREQIVLVAAGSPGYRAAVAAAMSGCMPVQQALDAAGAVAAARQTPPSLVLLGPELAGRAADILADPAFEGARVLVIERQWPVRNPVQMGVPEVVVHISDVWSPERVARILQRLAAVTIPDGLHTDPTIRRSAPIVAPRS